MSIDPKETHLVKELKHDRGILGCRYDSTGRFVFAGGQCNDILRWDLQSEAEELKPLRMSGHESWSRAITLFPDGKHLATGDYVGKVIVWPTQGDTLKPILNIDAHQGSVRALSISPDGKLLASSGNDHRVRVWSMPNGRKLLDLEGHESHVYNVAFHPAGDALVSADLKGIVRHWSIPTGKLVRKIDASELHTYSVKYTVDVGGVRGMRFSPDGKILACTGAVGEKGIAHSGNARVLLFDWKTGKRVKTLRPEKEVIATAWGARFHPAGFVVGCGGSRTGGYLWFWQGDAETETHLFKFKTRGPGFDLDFSPDASSIAVAHYDGAVRIYSLLPAPKAVKKTKRKTKK